jgi:hypothetical protein
VADAREAYAQSTANGAVGVHQPTVLRDEATATEQWVAEVKLYGDCLLRFVSGTYQVGALNTWLQSASKALVGQVAFVWLGINSRRYLY